MEQDTAIFERLYMEYRNLCLISQSEPFDMFKMAELAGKVTFAAEINLISIDEWETLFDKIMGQYKRLRYNGV